MMHWPTITFLLSVCVVPFSFVGLSYGGMLNLEDESHIYFGELEMKNDKELGSSIKNIIPSRLGGAFGRKGITKSLRT